LKYHVVATVCRHNICSHAFCVLPLQNNAFRMQKERQTEWARPGRVFSRNINRGGYSRSQYGFTQEFRVVKDNRSKQKEAGETMPEASHNRNSSNELSVPNVGDKR